MEPSQGERDTLKPPGRPDTGMPTVAVEFAGEGVREVEGETYADLLGPFDVSRHEVAVLVDGTPVPTDAPVPEGVGTVQVVRLVEGG